jgi:hypothetical protein
MTRVPPRRDSGRAGSLRKAPKRGREYKHEAQASEFQPDGQTIHLLAPRASRTAEPYGCSPAELVVYGKELGLGASWLRLPANPVRHEYCMLWFGLASNGVDLG